MLGRLGNGATARSGTANLVVDLDPMTIKSITGYRSSTAFNNFDLSGMPIGAAARYSIYRNKQFSEELQISGNAGSLQYIGGLYYSGSRNEHSEVTAFFGTPIAQDIFNNDDYVHHSKDLFAHQLQLHRRTAGNRRYPLHLGQAP